ncbi:uncharacterized protein MELLADRAFT_104509 [Melampsora larici-populina 98AG31]|uniref:DH domain-containing protein n=1 Tax=Melampsora larici-populina (strain 98AG31 / pathotype 3-4-7) TaxID=747676 RepID=F4REX7_MELLP|nr:uncharacterized protein MELLADRAFT_104509 [Melampsora larici-populina 98AG31]EGG09184.1 hypothetical protein MELLADRAFT_104509 [Melampsora larici-populina 98AG31]
MHHHHHQSPSSLKELINHPSPSHHQHHQHRHFLTLNSILSPSSVTPQSHYRTQSSKITNQSPNDHPQSPNQLQHHEPTSFFIHPTNSKSHLTDEFLSTDEFASAEEGDESIWIAGSADDPELSSSYTSSSATSSNQSNNKPISKPIKSPFLSIRETLIRPSLPLSWTSAPNLKSSDSNQSSKHTVARKSKSTLPTPISRHSDQIPTPSHQIQQPTPPEERRPQLRAPQQVRKSSSKEDFTAQQHHRSSKLISHPVAKSLSRAFGSDFFNLNHKPDQSTPSQENRKSKPTRPRLPSSTSSYLSFKSFHHHHSPQSPHEDHHPHHQDPKNHRLSSVEMSKPMISLPLFLTPSSSALPLSHPRSHSSPGTILTDQTHLEEHHHGLGHHKRRHRQLTSDEKPSSRNSSTLYLKQLSNLFHPHLSHHHLNQTPRERLVSTISTQSSAMAIPPTWKEEVAKEDYLNLLSLYGPQEMKRQEVIYELMETERRYVSQVSKLMRLVYKSEEIEHESIFEVLPIEIKLIFEELKKILRIHEADVNLSSLRSKSKVKENVAKDWLKIINRFKVYETFLIKFEKSIQSIEELKKLDSDHRYWIGLKRIERLETDDLRFGQSEVFNGLSLTSFLLKPVQRLMKYPLFFKETEEEEQEEEDGVGEGERFKDVEVIVFEHEILIGIEVFKLTRFDERLISSGIIKVWVKSNLGLGKEESEVSSGFGFGLPILVYGNLNESKERKKLKEFVRLLNGLV